MLLYREVKVNAAGAKILVGAGCAVAGRALPALVGLVILVNKESIARIAGMVKKRRIETLRAWLDQVEIKRGLAPKLDRGFHPARWDLEPEREGLEVIGLRDMVVLLASTC